MSESENNCVIGYSGHAYVVIEAAKQLGLNVSFYSDIHEAKNNPFELIYIGCECDENFRGKLMPVNFIPGIGDNKLRRKVTDKILSLDKKIISVIHPGAHISLSATIGIGTFVSSGAAVNALSVIGNYCILNTSCVIEHECILNDFVHIAPGAVLSGNVTVGENTFIGANSVVKQGVKIGKNVVIGAGAVVITDIEDNSTYAGNPAKRIK